MSAWVIACCGCGRALMKDGSAGVQLVVDGLLQIGAAADGVATFESRAEGDLAAMKAGWSIRDDEGPNHRCPTCPLPRYYESRGAYIAVDKLVTPDQIVVIPFQNGIYMHPGIKP